MHNCLYFENLADDLADERTECTGLRKSQPQSAECTRQQSALPSSPLQRIASHCPPLAGSQM
eukprot:1060009-Amphidinium_carterae.1